jgi:hypothetical protein
MNRKERSNPKKVPLSQDFGTSAEFRSVSPSAGADPQKPVHNFGTENPKRRKTVGHGKVEIQDQDSHFPTAQNACGARKKRPFTQNTSPLSWGFSMIRLKPMRMGSIPFSANTLSRTF